MANGKIELCIQNIDAREAYVSLPRDSSRGTVGSINSTIDLADLIQYDGPDIRLCFNKDKSLVGIEVVSYDEVQ